MPAKIGSVDFMFKVNMFDSVISNVVNIEKINDSDLWLLGVVFRAVGRSENPGVPVVMWLALSAPPG